MKTSDQVKPTYAPVYAAALYPQLAQIFVKNGYALAVHGSLQRDLDLIAVPWVATPDATPEQIVKELTETFWIRTVGDSEVREHGRLVYTVSIGHGECAIDLSFMPLKP